MTKAPQDFKILGCLFLCPFPSFRRTIFQKPKTNTLSLIIANRAYKMFIQGDLTALSDSDSADTKIIQEV